MSPRQEGTDCCPWLYSLRKWLPMVAAVKSNWPAILELVDHRRNHDHTPNPADTTVTLHMMAPGDDGSLLHLPSMPQSYVFNTMYGMCQAPANACLHIFVNMHASFTVHSVFFLRGNTGCTGHHVGISDITTPPLLVKQWRMPRWYPLVLRVLNPFLSRTCLVSRSAAHFVPRFPELQKLSSDVRNFGH